MTTAEFLQELDARVAKYDLLCHPFYKAWSAGELTRDDLREYARDYFHHVEAFPTYLAELAIRLEEGEMRQAVLQNLCDEKGVGESGEESRPHSDLWLDFAEGVDAGRDLHGHKPLPEIAALLAHFHYVASEGAPVEALAAFYAYESQVPRVATEKARGLRAHYGADEKTLAYFMLHATADVYHSQVWRQQLANTVEANPATAECALAAAEAAAQSLWRALDGIDSRRLAGALV